MPQTIRAMRVAALLAFTALALPLGCSASSGSNDFTGGSGGGTATTTTSGGTTADIDGGIHFGGAGGGSVVPGDEIAEVFAHSASTLFRLDPTTKVVTTVGPFQGCDFSDVIDIALNKDGAMFATTSGGLYRIDKATAKCTLISNGNYPNSLSFVPEGTVDPNAEALVGYEGSTYVRIDLASGAVTPIGGLVGGYVSSGDIVSVIGGGTYLTVYGNGCADCIIEVDPKTGVFKKMIGPLGHSSVYGLAFWGGSAYGFSSFGELFQINLATAQSTIIPVPGAPAGLSFYGAGSSTKVPLTLPE